MKQIRFENLGVFVYSDSEDLPSHGLSGQVDKNTAEGRYRSLADNSAAADTAAGGHPSPAAAATGNQQKNRKQGGYKAP